MATPRKHRFLDSFPDHVFRCIDQTGAGRPPVSSAERRDDLNAQGYEAYFTVNGFRGQPDARREHCTSINAFFADIDGRKDPAELARIKSTLAPTFIVETKNGYHLYWLLDEPVVREEVEPAEWDAAVLRWERIEAALVSALAADPVVKDLTRILRIPDTLYWKKSGDAWKAGPEAAPFRIKGIHKDLSARYSMEQVEEAFPAAPAVAPFPETPEGESMKRYADAERRAFFDAVDAAYPVAERPSFQKLVSGKPGTLPPNVASRNAALLVAASLMRQAGWAKKDALAHLAKVGWHGIEAERSGMREIQATVESAYRGGYTYSYRNEVIAFNATPEEQGKLQAAYTAVAKARRETDKTRFSNYEYEIRSRYPHLKKNEAGVVFNYDAGVYRMLSDQDVSGIILNALHEDMLWGYRTKRNVADKVACLLAIIPDLELTDDKGDWLNVRNGLLQLSTGVLMPHTPDFVSLVQSPVAYDPAAEAPTWEACVREWTRGAESPEKAQVLQQFSGYLLTSSMAHAKALFLVGDGGNGKSTFADTISMVVGPDATSRIDLEDLYSTFGLKGLIGKRLNVVEEVGGNFYQSHKLKKLVSGESLTINMKFKDQFRFTPEAKFIFAVNTMPRVDDTSTATERRILVVQFNNNFRDRPDTSLRFAGGALAQELPGILNWMLAGYRSLAASGRFPSTAEQAQALAEYREENSSVDGFAAERLEFVPGSRLTTAMLYGEYKDYCLKDGRKYKSMIAFSKELKAIGRRSKKFAYIERENGHGSGFFEGVKIVNTWDAEFQKPGTTGPVPSDYTRAAKDDDEL